MSSSHKCWFKDIESMGYEAFDPWWGWRSNTLPRATDVQLMWPLQREKHCKPYKSECWAMAYECFPNSKMWVLLNQKDVRGQIQRLVCLQKVEGLLNRNGDVKSWIWDALPIMKTSLVFFIFSHSASAIFARTISDFVDLRGRPFEPFWAGCDTCHVARGPESLEKQSFQVVFERKAADFLCRAIHWSLRSFDEVSMTAALNMQCSS